METKDTGDFKDIIFTPQDVASIGTEYLRERRDEIQKGIKLGLRSIDEDLIPVLPGELVTIIGRPGSGKTGFMMRWARWRSRQLLQEQIFNRVVVYVTYEQHVEDLHAFHVAAEEHISITSMSRGILTPEQWEQVDIAGARRAGLPLWFLGHSMARRMKRPRITISNLALALEEIEGWSTEQNLKLDMVFIDYLQRMPFEHRVESKAIGVSDNLDRLKDGALAFACPFVVGVQAKREVDMRRLPVPGMADGQWTSNIEQSSDKSLSVTRPRKYKKEGERFGKTTVEGHCQMLICLLKQKLGIDNQAYWAYFDPAYNQLDDLEMRAYVDVDDDYEAE